MNNYIDNDPVICHECGGTGMHPWKNTSCPLCHGTGELTDDVYDERYKKTVYRAHSESHDRLFV